MVSNSLKVTFSFGFLTAFAVSGTSFANEDLIQFNRDIRPILSDACFQCHGPDEKERKGGFRLDLEKEAFTAGESGVTPIVPGKPDESELLARVLLPDDDIDVMPPPEIGKSLSQFAERNAAEMDRAGCGV